MKATLAVIIAFVFLFIAWLFLAGALFGIGYAAAMSRPGLLPLHAANIAAAWLLGPGFGGFVATFATSRLFKSVGPRTIATGFISAIVMFFLFAIFLELHGDIGTKETPADVLIALAQLSALVLGALIGRAAALEGQALNHRT
jgi:hypothetical protein